MDSCIATESRPPIPPRSPLRSRSLRLTSKKVAFAAEPLLEANEFYDSLDHSIDQTIESLEHLWPPQQLSIDPIPHSTTLRPDSATIQDYFFHPPSSDTASSHSISSSGSSTIPSSPSTSITSTTSISSSPSSSSSSIRTPHSPCSEHHPSTPTSPTQDHVPVMQAPVQQMFHPSSSFRIISPPKSDDWYLEQILAEEFSETDVEFYFPADARGELGVRGKGFELDEVPKLVSPQRRNTSKKKFSVRKLGWGFH